MKTITVYPDSVHLVAYRKVCAFVNFTHNCRQLMMSPAKRTRQMAEGRALIISLAVPATGCHCTWVEWLPSVPVDNCLAINMLDWWRNNEYLAMAAVACCFLSVWATSVQPPGVLSWNHDRGFCQSKASLDWAHGLAYRDYSGTRFLRN